MKYFANRMAWTEVVGDSIIGTLINFPLNLALIAVCRWFELSVLNTGIAMTVTFFILSCFRKYAIRMHFSKKNKKNKHNHKI